MLRRGIARRQAYSVVASSAPAFDPATLNLTGWWRGAYSTSPLAGTASAGGSGSRSLSEATNPPSVGTALNGIAPMSFDGVDDRIGLSGTGDTYLNANTYSGCALVKIAAIDTDSATIYQNDALIATAADAWWGVHLQSTGPTAKLRHLGVSIDAQPSVTIATGAWGVLAWQHTGTEASIGWNRTWGTAITADDLRPNGLADTLRLGCNYAPAAFLNGDVQEVMLADSTTIATNLTSILSYFNSRYGLAL